MLALALAVLSAVVTPLLWMRRKVSWPWYRQWLDFPASLLILLLGILTFNILVIGMGGFLLITNLYPGGFKR
jgi:hypothetical protein